MDLLIWLVLSVLIGYGIFQSGQFPQFATALNFLLFVVISLAVGRVAQGILSIPPRLYFAEKDKTKLLTDTYESPNPPCPLIITPYQGHQNNTPPSEIRIRIENPLPTQSIKHLRITLDELLEIKSPNLKVSIAISTAIVDRGFIHGRDFEPDGMISPNPDAIVFVAKVNSRTITFDLARPLQQACSHARRNAIGIDESFADFEIILLVSGFIEDKPFMRTRYSILADFEGDDPVLSKATILALEKLCE